jgi:hypothetical protein
MTEEKLYICSAVWRSYINVILSGGEDSVSKSEEKRGRSDT